jgi:prepilin-type N-terminal cleavage/methylation domain-containing protein
MAASQGQQVCEGKMPVLKKLDQTKRKHSSHGFSLIELLIVVAVILVIAAIAIPNFIRSKMRANETGAVANLRTISTAEVVYSTTYGIGYSPTLIALGGNNPPVPDATQAGLIDGVLGSGSKSGYGYTYAVTNSDANGHVVSYSINADPLNVGVTGDRHFYTDETDIIRFNTSAPATSTDSPVQ